MAPAVLRTGPRRHERSLAIESMGAFGFLRQSSLDRRRSGSVMAMGQAVWTGSISFGLVSIPVKLYPATEPKDVRFHLYDRLTGKRVRYERVTRAEDAPTFEPEPAEDELAATEPAPSRQEDRSDRAVAPSFETRPVEPMDVVRGVELPTPTVTAREVKMAQPLIAARARPWLAGKHGDAYREELLELLRSKRPTTPAEPVDEPAQAPIADLMAALRASVEAAKKGGAKKARRAG